VEQVLIDNPIAGVEYVVQMIQKGTRHDDDPEITPQMISIVISMQIV
jgi:hypothetical protein